MTKTRGDPVGGGRQARGVESCRPATVVAALDRAIASSQSNGVDRAGRWGASDPRLGRWPAPPATRARWRWTRPRRRWRRRGGADSRAGRRRRGNRHRRVPGDARHVRRRRRHPGLLDLATCRTSAAASGVRGGAWTRKSPSACCGPPACRWSTRAGRGPAFAREPEPALARARSLLGTPSSSSRRAAGHRWVHRVKRYAAGLRRPWAGACRYDRKVLIEQAVDAREIEFAVLGNDKPRRVASPARSWSSRRRVLFVSRPSTSTRSGRAAAFRSTSPSPHFHVQAWPSPRSGRWSGRHGARRLLPGPRTAGPRCTSTR